MSNTDFNFGWNQKADNADPWGRNTGPDGKTPLPEADNSDSGPVSHDYFCNCDECSWLEINCNQIKSMIQNVTRTVRQANRHLKGNKDMAQFSTDTNAQQGKTGRKPGQGNGKVNLGPEHLSQTPVKAKIIMARIPPMWYALELKLLVRGNVYVWRLKANNPNLAKVGESFGFDTDHLPEKEFMIANTVDEWSGNPFPTFIEKIGDKASTRK
jgi:hypothetical protein